MKKNILFTCPHCSGHQLMMVEVSLSRYDIMGFTFDENQQLCAADKIPSDSLRGEILGYRCKLCRYPDAHKNDSCKSFGWPDMDALMQSGSISWHGCNDKMEHKCMLCLPDGNMTPLLVTVNHPGRLSMRERASIIDREARAGAILLCQTDAGIKAFDCKNWSAVKRHQLCYICAE